MNIALIIAAGDADFTKLIIFIIIAGVVGFFKLLEKIKESQSQQPPSRPAQRPTPRPRPQPAPKPTWQANTEEVRKFLEQISQRQEKQEAPPPIAPPIIRERTYTARVERPRPIVMPAPEREPEPVAPTVFREHMEEEGEEALAADARALLQAETAATHVERAREIEDSTLAVAQSVSVPMLALERKLAGVEEKAKRPVTAASVKEILRERDSLRRAFVLSEILGPPRGA
jgi:hypothetical protein